jgi:hypothetical protein
LLQRPYFSAARLAVKYGSEILLEDLLDYQRTARGGMSTRDLRRVLHGYATAMAA